MGPVNLGRLMAVLELVDRPGSFMYPSLLLPGFYQENWPVLRDYLKRSSADYLLSKPSFESFLHASIVSEAAKDPSVAYSPNTLSNGGLALQLLTPL